MHGDLTNYIAHTAEIKMTTQPTDKKPFDINDRERKQYEWVDHGDHILASYDCFDEGLIDACIEVFDDMEERGLTLSRKESHDGSHKHLRADSSIFYSAMDCMLSKPMQDMMEIINSEIIDSWLNEYPVIKTGLYKELYTSNMKIQKTRLTEGYHNWHSEHTSKMQDVRTILAFMVYLNDVDEGGETEFLYQSKRIQPRRNTFIIWPAGFTHTHRGNPPLSGEKYVITGWINVI